MEKAVPKDHLPQAVNDELEGMGDELTSLSTTYTDETLGVVFSRVSRWGQDEWVGNLDWVNQHHKDKKDKKEVEVELVNVPCQLDPDFKVHYLRTYLCP